MTGNNKNRIIILMECFLLPVAHLYAQYEYQPFVKEGKAWLMNGRSDTGDSYSYDFQYLMQGDTVIGGEVMKKVHLIDEVRFHDNCLHYLGAVKEGNKQVYITYADKDSPVLLYDFSIDASKHDPPVVILHGGRYASAINRVDLYQINSALRHEQRGNRHYSPDVSEAIPYVVENLDGIGSIEGRDPFQCQLWGRSRIKMCYEDGACIYYSGDGGWYTVKPTYHPLLKHQRCWEYRRSKEETPSRVCVLGDTIFVNAKSSNSGWLYRKVYCADKNVYGDTVLHYYGAMREEGAEVYLIPKGKTVSERQLFFDYGLEDGDVAEIAGSTVKVIEIDSVASGDYSYRRLTLHQIERGKDTGRTCNWIEGIGSDCGLFQSLPWDIRDLQLVVSDNDNCIYSYPIVPSVLETVQVKHAANNVIFNLQGRQLQSNPGKGLYIQDGKKFLVK